MAEIRDPNRLDKFYEELKNMHKERVPDRRFGQWVMNLERWFYDVKKTDIFYLEENQFLDMFKNFMKGDN